MCKTYALVFLSLALLSSCQRDNYESVNTAVPIVHQGTIVAMGDSLTEGLGVTENKAYPAKLEGALNDDGYLYQVINAGVSGETTSGALSRINWILTLNPDLVILETGANDAFRGVDLTLTKNNIDTIITTLKENNIEVILAGMQISQNLGTDYVKQFAAIYPDLASKHQIALIPFFLENVAAVRSLNQPDGIHPTAEGYDIIVKTVFPYVKAHLDKI